jgi:NADPH2:quinone reductase
VRRGGESLPRRRVSGFPLSDVPLQTIAEQAAAGRLRAKPSRVFRFGEIREAHRVMEANEAHGKMVVVVHD